MAAVLVRARGMVVAVLSDEKSPWCLSTGSSVGWGRSVQNPSAAGRVVKPCRSWLFRVAMGRWGLRNATRALHKAQHTETGWRTASLFVRSRKRG